MTNTVSSTWFITGASSGIGLALTQAAASRGDNVVALARDVAALGALADEHAGRVLAPSADVRRQAELERAVARAVDAFGGIDVSQQRRLRALRGRGGVL